MSSQGIYFWPATRLGKGLLAGKGNVVSKCIYKGIDILWLHWQNKLSSVDLENWFMISEKSGNFYYHDKWQPCS